MAMDGDYCHPGPPLRSLPQAGMGHDIHRAPRPILSECSERHTRQNGPGDPALLRPDHPLQPASGSRRAAPRPPPHAATQVPTSALTATHDTHGAQDHVLCANETEAWPRPGLVCPPLGLGTGGV